MIRSLARKFSSYGGGKYSKMMDMGGVPPVKSSAAINFGQKNKVQAIAIDFNLITRAVEEASKSTAQSSSDTTPAIKSSINNMERTSATALDVGHLKPNVQLIQNIASLLNVKMGGISKKKNDEVAGVAGLLSKAPNDDASSSSLSAAKTRKSTTATHQPPFILDIRSKYASKLEIRLDGAGGISSLDLQKEENLANRGDASMHLAARAIATNQVANTGPARWLAASGTSKLLSFITSRSMKIALLPVPRSQHTDLAAALPTAAQAISVNKAMEELTQQLPQVPFHLLIKGDDGTHTAGAVVKQVQNAMALDHGILPIHTMIVSDRDDYLREGRDLGFYTCHVRPKNARRGNVTTNFTAETISEVEDVINELNGLSMNFVLTSSV